MDGSGSVVLALCILLLFEHSCTVREGQEIHRTLRIKKISRFTMLIPITCFPISDQASQVHSPTQLTINQFDDPSGIAKANGCFNRFYVRKGNTPWPLIFAHPLIDRGTPLYILTRLYIGVSNSQNQGVSTYHLRGVRISLVLGQRHRGNFLPRLSWRSMSGNQGLKILHPLDRDQSPDHSLSFTHYYTPLASPCFILVVK
jgi:hypothetical protein